MKGISFDNTHSFTDLNLVLSEVNIPPASPKTNYIDIPAGDGSVDLSEALGEIKFNDREAKFVFTVFPSDDFEEKKTEVNNLVNGKRMKVVVDKDPNYYWVGRCWVDEYESDKNIHKITIGAMLSPYKLKHNVTVHELGTGYVTLQNSRMSVVPTIICSEDSTVWFDDTEYNLSEGTHKILDIKLVEGGNDFDIYTDGTVTIKYQEGDL